MAVVLVKACLNGSREPGEHPALPLTAEELTADAARVAEADTQAVHVHPRDARGAQTLRSDPANPLTARLAFEPEERAA